jgi:membrane-associated protein
MPALTPELILLLGPGLLFLLAFAETSLPAGLVVPAGVALSIGAFLGTRGLLELEDVVLYAGLGGLLGDSVGYWLGRRGAVRIRSSERLLARIGRRYEGFTARHYRKSALVSVSLARTISFIRTLMPTTAGMSGMPYLRFLAFDLLGVMAWLALYTTAGILAEGSWRVVSTWIGTGWAVTVLLISAAIWGASRLRRRGEETAEEAGG